ncbi:MAG: hypothetical protein QM762_26425 [Chryseolinea sp.]
MKTLDFFQVSFDEDQTKRLYDFSVPYRNESLTPYFENSVIADVVIRSQADLIGIASCRLREKRNSIVCHRALEPSGGISLTQEKLSTRILMSPF